MSISNINQKIATNLPDNAGLGNNPKITPGKHREVEQALSDELKARGVLPALITDLANLAGSETDMIWVSGYGLFRYVAVGLVADNVTIFAAQQAGFWQLQKPINPSGSFDLAPGVNVAVDLTKANIFKLALNQNSNIQVPANFKYHGLKIRFQFTQTGAGSYTPTFSGGAGGFAFSFQYPTPDFTGQVAGAISFIDFEYSLDLDRWVCSGMNINIIP